MSMIARILDTWEGRLVSGVYAAACLTLFAALVAIALI